MTHHHCDDPTHPCPDCHGSHTHQPQIYIIMVVEYNGRVRWGQTSKPEIPADFAYPGETAFLIQPLAIQARHSHEVAGPHGS